MALMAMTERPATPTVRAWCCWHCHRYLGRIVGGVLHEANGGKSGLPVVRVCPGCGKRNVAMR